MKPKINGKGDESIATPPPTSTFPSLHQSDRQGSKFSSTPGIPLLDGVNELLEKEKTLYRLQAIEANAAAEALKLKYEKLIGEVADTAAWFGNYETCDIAAGIETSSPAATSRNEDTKDVDFSKLLCPSISRTIDVSYQCLAKSDVANLAQAIREQTHTNPYFVIMRHCNLSDAAFSTSQNPKTADVFSQLISAPLVEALDFSYNDLGAGFENTLVETLRLKKHSLQYLLLNGNVRMSLCPNVSDILSIMSDKSWGICVTLGDMLDIKDHVKKKAAVGEATDYSVGSHKAMRCADFLKILNEKLRQVKRSTSTLCLTEKNTTLRAYQKQYNTEQASSARIHTVERRPGGLQAMSVLGLTDACLSRTSIDLLKTTLKISISSLTDLDLSYSFLGSYGAVMIGDGLALGGSQIIRLGLTGNHLGDGGMTIISNSLLSTKTLTYLDIRSNQITDGGLQSLVQVLKLQKGNIPSSTNIQAHRLSHGNCLTLSTVRLSGNFISERAMSRAEKTIRSTGRDLKLFFAGESLQLAHQGIEDPSNSGREISCIAAIYYSPQIVCHDLLYREGAERKIYGIDIKYVHPLRESEALVMEWYARIEEDFLGKTKLIPPMVQIDRREHMNDDYKIVTNLDIRGIYFEVKCVGSKGKCTGALTYVTSLIGLGSGGWVQFRSSTYGPLPARGSIEIWAISKGQVETRLECRSLVVSKVLLSRSSLVESDSSTTYRHIDSNKLLDRYHVVGGDVPYWSLGTNSLISKNLIEELNSCGYWTSFKSKTAVDANGFLSEGHTPLRALQWIESRCFGVLNFSIKLSVADGVGTMASPKHACAEITSTYNGQLNELYTTSFSSMNGKSRRKPIGYAYSVYICCCDGSLRSIETHDTCIDHKRIAGEKSVIDNLDDENRSNPLAPWIWRSISIYLGEIGPNDIVLICGNPTIDRSVNNTFKSKCSVQIKGCQLLASVEGKRFKNLSTSAFGSSTIFPPREHYSQANESPATFVLHNDMKIL